jgi:hypothetical protein
MPRLLIAAPCQKAILDKDEGLISLIAIVNGAKVQFADDQPVADDAAIASNWAFLTTWRIEDGDESKRFEQRLEVISPSGKVRQTAQMDWQFGANSKNHNNVLRGNMTFVSEQGTQIIRISWRESGQEEWIRAFDYPFEIVHMAPGEEE